VNVLRDVPDPVLVAPTNRTPLVYNDGMAEPTGVSREAVADLRQAVADLAAEIDADATPDREVDTDIRLD
jgi:hypothetical protein